jgi:hypothetical protein
VGVAKGSLKKIEPLIICLNNAAKIDKGIDYQKGRYNFLNIFSKVYFFWGCPHFVRAATLRVR